VRNEKKEENENEKMKMKTIEKTRLKRNVRSKKKNEIEKR
jgi:hypothetical protein